MLKAITASLLMEQVVAPNFKFKAKRSAGGHLGPGELNRKDSKSRRRNGSETSSIRPQRSKAQILQDQTMLKAMPGNITRK